MEARSSGDFGESEGYVEVGPLGNWVARSCDVTPLTGLTLVGLYIECSGSFSQGMLEIQTSKPT